LEIITPHRVDILGLLLVARIFRTAILATLPASFELRSFEIIVMPDAIHPLEIDVPAILP
jgi:hypothetical protein